MKNRILLSALALVMFALAGCESEFDQPYVPPIPGNPIVDIHCNPDADVSVFELSEDKNLVYAGHTPVIGLELEAKSYAVVFSQEGYKSKAYGLRLALGDTNIAVNENLEALPIDPPEPEELWANLDIDPYNIKLGEEIMVNVDSNALLGIIEPLGIFVQAGPHSFSYRPEHSGEFVVSFAVIGEDNQYLVRREAFYVRPADLPTVSLNAWASQMQVTPPNTMVSLSWSSSNADSVTIAGYANNNNIGLSGTIEVEVFASSTYIFQAWQAGSIVRTEPVFVELTPLVQPSPELTFYASAYEVESDSPDWTNYLVGINTETWLIWNVKFYDENTDEMVIDRFPTYGDLGPRGLMPVIVNSDITYVASVYRNGSLVMSKTVRITVVDVPPPAPQYFDIAWDLNTWVGARPEDPHQVDLVNGLSLPENIKVEVWARLSYSSSSQDNESGAIGGLTASGQEHWAYLSDPSCPVFPDQGSDRTDTFFIGTITGFREGRMVLRHGVDFPCWQGKVCPPPNPNSLWIQRLTLRVWMS